MKLVHMLSGVAVAVSLAACADKSADIQTPAPNPNTSINATQSTIAQPNVSGSVWIRQKVALPPDAVLTVTLADASQAWRTASLNCSGLPGVIWTSCG